MILWCRRRLSQKLIISYQWWIQTLSYGGGEGAEERLFFLLQFAFFVTQNKGGPGPLGPLCYGTDYNLYYL